MDWQVTQVDAHGVEKTKEQRFSSEKKTTKVDIVNFDFDDKGGTLFWGMDDFVLFNNKTNEGWSMLTLSI